MPTQYAHQLMHTWYMPTVTRTPLQSSSITPGSIAFLAPSMNVVIQKLCTSRQHRNLAPTSKPRKISETFGAMKINIEIEIEIASFRQDCRKYQDCPLLGNVFKELIGTVSGGILHH